MNVNRNDTFKNKFSYLPIIEENISKLRMGKLIKIYKISDKHLVMVSSENVGLGSTKTSMATSSGSRHRLELPVVDF